MTATLETLHGYDGFAYWGESKGWGIVVGTHRDADALTRSNFAVISSDLSTRFPNDVRVESFSNWLVGWSETILVRPDSEAWGAAIEWLDKLSDYPVADDENYSETETAECIESLTMFIQDELRQYRIDAAACAEFIYSEWEGEPIGTDYYGWPHIERGDSYRSPREIERDRDRVAAGIRAWRKWKRERIAA